MNEAGDTETLELNLARQPGYLALKSEIEAFLFYEADLLDTRRYDAWLNLLADDLIYFMPMRFNVGRDGKQQPENTTQGQGISWFDEDKWTLSKRVEQIQTGHHHAEEPLSRTAHLITNVRLQAVQPDFVEAEEVTVGSNFHVQQNRVNYENHSFIGRRVDILRRENSNWRIRRREILLEQSILLAKNLTTFF